MLERDRVGETDTTARTISPSQQEHPGSTARDRQRLGLVVRNQIIGDFHDLIDGPFLRRERLGHLGGANLM